MSKTLILKKEKQKTQTSYRPIMVYREAYELIKGIAEESGMSLVKVTSIMLEFAAQNITIEED